MEIEKKDSKNSLNEAIDREYFDPFYAPMSTASAFLLEILYEALANYSDKSSVAYHQHLNQCQMDFSLASLARLDKFLIALNKQQPIQKAKLFDDPKISHLFFALVAYVGEVFSRARGQAALWFSGEDIKNIHLIFKKSMPASLWFAQEGATHDLMFAYGSLYEASIEQYSLFMILFSRDKTPLNLDNVECFLPINSILNMLTGEQTYPLYDYVVNNLKAFGEDLPQDHAIPPNPNVFVNIALKQKLQALQQHQRYYLQMNKPSSIQKDEQDPLFKQLKSLGTLYQEGKVVWAALVQANESMFLPKQNNKFSSLGEVIYDPTGRTHIRKLLDLAKELSNLKNTTPDEDDQLQHAQRLTHERDAVSGMDFPRSLSHLPIKVSSMMFWRKHLPNGLLSQSFFPILISEKYEGAVTILPSRFWSEEFVEAWLSVARQQYNGNDYNIMPKLLEKEEQHLPAWTLSTDLSPEEFQKESLFPKITDLFPDHVYPEKPIAARNNTSDQPLFDPTTLKWWAMLAAADNAATEEDKQRLTEAAKKFHSENFISFGLRNDGTVDIKAPLQHTPLEIKNSEKSHAKPKQLQQSNFNKKESKQQKRKPIIASEFTILIVTAIILFIVRGCMK